MKRRFLIVEDDQTLQFILTRLLQGQDHEIVVATDGTAALQELSKGAFDVIITDLLMEPMDGLELLRRIAPPHHHTPVIVMTAAADLESAAHAMRAGAFDYVAKPLKVPVLKEIIQRALDLRDQESALVRGDSSGPGLSMRLNRIVAVSPSTSQACDILEQLAATMAPLSIIGEPGTGRTWAAKAAHEQSGRAPLVVVDCAKDENRPADPGRVVQRVQKWVTDAYGGTLVLQHCDQANLQIQQALADWMAVRKPGGAFSPGDVRLMTTSETPLNALADQHRFLPALAHRIGLIQIHFKPLRDRPEDLPALCRLFLSEFEASSQIMCRISAPVLQILDAYAWPGNVQELRTVLEAAGKRAGDAEITPEHLPESIVASVHLAETPAHSPLRGRSYQAFLKEKEAERLQKLMSGFSGNIHEAAEAAGVPPQFLGRKTEETWHPIWVVKPADHTAEPGVWSRTPEWPRSGPRRERKEPADMVDPFRKPDSCRSHQVPRCGICGLHMPHCVCPQFPDFHLPERLTLVQHAVEIERPTNTGRLIARLWGNSEILAYGRRSAPFDVTPITRPGWTYALLFLRADSISFEQWRSEHAGVDPARTAFVIPDGSWSQSSHMSRRILPLRFMPCVRLPPGPPGLWTIRRPRDPSQLCTAEAAIRLAAALGHTEEAAIMLDWLRTIHHRMLVMKGTAPRAEAAVEDV